MLDFTLVTLAGISAFSLVAIRADLVVKMLSTLTSFDDPPPGVDWARMEFSLRVVATVGAFAGSCVLVVAVVTRLIGH